jgi:ppGpp synthetase/RelA/SpoT-type nucleotidyltranferase
MVEPLTISQVNRLGRRIRDTDPMAEADLRLLQQLLHDHASVLASVQRDLIDLVGGVTPTSRLKTVATIVDKLRREHSMSLSRMADIAGIRIVRDMDREEQDQLVRDILGAIGPGEVIDRRRHPSHGYRAVHLVVRRDNRSVEIQIRTAMQNTWAQIVERLGDSWGRQIRYGAAPDDAGRLLRESSVTRSEFWAIVQRLSDFVDVAETTAVGRYDQPEDATVSKDDVDELLREVARLTAGIDSM